MSKTKLLILGATGFIGRNLLESFLTDASMEIFATYHLSEPDEGLKEDERVHWLKVDLNHLADVANIMMDKDVVIQAAATTSGAQTIVNSPHHHVTDNAVMNSLILRQSYEKKVKHLIFFSCTTMYKSSSTPVKEEDFDGEIESKYFGVGWTKVYIEKMCEFYSRLGKTKYTVIRHSNIYGPHDKYDLEKSHVFGATVAKVMGAKGKPIVVWGDGSDERDLLHVDDLVGFVRVIMTQQVDPFELVNLGSGETVSVKELVKRIMKQAGIEEEIEFDLSKPSIGFKLCVDSSKARDKYAWKPKITLDEGVLRTLDWYQSYYLKSRG